MKQQNKNPLSVLLSIALVLAFIVGAYAYTKLGSLPSMAEIHPALEQEPRQFPTREKEFLFSYKDTDYGIVPVAKYELWGLVVTHNDIMEFTDIYHDENSIDIKDICVIWGDNLTSNNYRLVEYYSEPWTCFFRTDSNEVYDNFEPQALSNSHLLSDSPEIRELITNTRIGDQIHLEGMLVNYFPEDHPSWVRASSIRRDDTGNGACEVVFIENYEILKRSNQQWWALFNACRWAIIVLIVLKLVLFTRQVYFRPAL